jgi:hypothetical protein
LQPEALLAEPKNLKMRMKRPKRKGNPTAMAAARAGTAVVAAAAVAVAGMVATAVAGMATAAGMAASEAAGMDSAGVAGMAATARMAAAAAAGIAAAAGFVVRQRPYSLVLPPKLGRRLDLPHHPARIVSVDLLSQVGTLPKGSSSVWILQASPTITLYVSTMGALQLA